MIRLVVATLVLVSAGVAATAQERPNYLTATYPAHALDGLLAMYGALKGENSALDDKVFELIGVAVAAQIPCHYCVYVHSKQAKIAGATDQEIREAVAMAGATRNFATVFNGMAYDFEAFKQEHDALVPPPTN